MFKNISGKVWVVSVIIAVLGAALYANVLNSPFKNLDDKYSIVDNSNIRSFGNIGKILSSSYFGDKHYYRPLVYLTYMAEYRFFKLNPFFYHLSNLLLHLIMAAAVYFLANMLVAGNSQAGFWAAILFVIHPINSEAVFNIADRAILLSAFFVVNAFLFFLWSEQNPGRLYRFLSLGSFALGLLAKESAVTLPFVLSAYLLIMKKENWRQLLRKLTPYFILLFIYGVVRKILGFTEIFAWHSIREMSLGFISFLSGVIEYLRLFVFPVDLYFDRSRPLFLSFSNWELWATVFFWGLLIFLLVLRREKISRIFWFLFVWFLLELAPVAQIFTGIGVGPGHISIAEHFLYCASVPVFIAIAIGAGNLYASRNKMFSTKTLAFFFGGMALFFALITLQQSYINSDPVLLFGNSVQHNGQNSRSLTALGIELGKRGHPREAEELFRRALKLDRHSATAAIGLGTALCRQGKLSECLAVYESIGDAGRWNDYLKQGLALAYNSFIDRYKKRLEQEPENSRVYYSLGVIYAKMNNPQEALVQFAKAFELDPQYSDAVFNLASVNEALGKKAEALVFYRRLMEITSAGEALKAESQKRINALERQLK